MKREARLLLNKGCDSLILSIEFFNRPHDIGRVTTTLILLDHGFEMLLKAAILHRNGRIREKRASETIGFDKCIRTGISDGSVKFLNEEQALILQGINILRDAEQHHLLDISENQFYIQVQSGITLFRDLLRDVFNRDLCALLPNRVLPVSTSAPIDLDILFENRAGLEMKVKDSEEKLIDIRQVKKYVKEIKEVLEAGATEEKREFIRSFILKVIIYNPNIAIDYIIPLKKRQSA